MTDESVKLGESARTTALVIEDLARRARDAAEARPHLVAILAELGHQADPKASILELAMVARIYVRARAPTEAP